MQWYVVIKTINGRRYMYRQKTYRVGKHVKTINQYIGPYDGRTVGGGHTDTAGATTLAIPFPSATKKPADLKALITVLIDPACASESWQKPWGTKRRVKSAVKTVQEVETLLTTLGVKLTEHDEGAYYNPASHVVNIPDKRLFVDRDDENATEGYYSTVLHELVHWTLGEKESGRKREHRSDDYAREELVAELGSMMLMRHFGISEGTGKTHAKYFQGWLSRCRSRKSSLDHAKREATRAVDYILKRGIMNK